MAEDLTGRTLLGKYKVVELLGKGGMGTVWRATHALTGRKLAIKVLDERFLSNSGIVQRFGREARAASAIQHPGIVEVLDIDQTDAGVPFLVMELLEGESLGSRIARRGKLSQEETVQIMTQLLEALDAAHAHGVIHRDLKPDNVFLVPRSKGVGETVKILDFGISQKNDERVAQLTLAGAVLGTPHYMAPEQALGESDVDARADVYAAAVVMYECVVGDVPFDAPNYNRLIHIILHDEPIPPRERGAQIDMAVEEVILVGMSKDRAQRPVSAGAFLDLVQAVSSESTMPFDRETLGFVREGRPMSGRPPSQPISRGTMDVVTLPSSPPPEPASYSVDELEIDLSPAPSRSSPPPRRSSPRPPPPSPEPSAAPALSFDDLDEDADEPPGLEVDEAALAALRTSIPPGRRSYGSLAAHTEPPPETASPEGSAGRTVLFTLGAIAILGGAIFGLRHLVRDDAPPEPVAVAPVAIEAEEESAPASVLPMVEVDVYGLPAGASLVLDGLPTREIPFQVREGTRHRLEISAPGYESRVIEFAAEGDTRLSGVLEAEPTPAQRRKRGRGRPQLR